jgi:hypothetical protein
MPSKKTPADRFREFAATVPPLPTSLLATAHVPAVSPEARRAAQLMVGGLGADNDRIVRIAASLDRLVQQSRARSASTGKRRRASRSRLGKARP